MLNGFALLVVVQTECFELILYGSHSSFYHILGRQFGVNRELSEYGADVHGVRQMIIYALKGMGSYARHARLLGEWDDSMGTFTTEVKLLAQWNI